MNWGLQTSLLIGSLGTLLFIILTARKVRMNIRYTVVWIVWVIAVMILSLFPTLIDQISAILGIATPVNAALLIFIFLAYLMNYYLFYKVSQQNEQIRSLTYELARLRKEIHEKK